MQTQDVSLEQVKAGEGVVLNYKPLGTPMVRKLLASPSERPVSTAEGAHKAIFTLRVSVLEEICQEMRLLAIPAHTQGQDRF